MKNPIGLLIQEYFLIEGKFSKAEKKLFDLCAWIQWRASSYYDVHMNLLALWLHFPAIKQLGKH